MKKAYFSFMYEFSNAVMLLAPTNRNHFRAWWEVSEYYRRLRDAN